MRSETLDLLLPALLPAALASPLLRGVASWSRDRCSDIRLACILVHVQQVRGKTFFQPWNMPISGHDRSPSSGGPQGECGALTGPDLLCDQGVGSPLRKTKGEGGFRLRGGKEETGAAQAVTPVPTGGKRGAESGWTSGTKAKVRPSY